MSKQAKPIAQIQQPPSVRRKSAGEERIFRRAELRTK
jgi:hypothetical protein